MDQFKEFTLRRIWAFAHLFFLCSSLGWVTDLFDGSILNLIPLILFISIFGVIWSVNRSFFVLMIVSQICYAISTLPDLQNHRFLAMFVNFGLLIGVNRGEFFNTKTLWMISRSVLIVYFFATFHKLNFDFFDPEVSCASQFLDHVLDLFPGNQIPGAVVIYSTVIIEALLVILLLSSSTWKWAAVLGITFHLGLSFDYYKMFINFTAVMSGLLAIIAIQDGAKNFLLNQSTLKWLSILVMLSLITVSFGLLELEYYTFILHSGLIIWCSSLILLVLNSNYPLPTEVSKIHIFLICLFILNGFSPYLGIKNRSSLAMYSNLQVSPEYSNHFIIKKGYDLFGFKGVTPEGLLGKIFPFNPSGPEERGKCVW